jgi:hypothetical protein
MIPLPVKFVFAALVLVLTLWLTGCTATFPLGERGKYGAVGLTVSYYPPSIDIIKEQPNIGGYRK